MKYERLWERLLEFLNEWSSAAEVEPGRIEVVLKGKEGGRPVVEVLMSQGQWEDMVTVAWGDFHLAAQEVRKSVLGLSRNERFLVYRQCELVPSRTPTLSVEPEDSDVSELPSQRPEEQFRWAAFDPREGEESREPPT